MVCLNDVISGLMPPSAQYCCLLQPEIDVNLFERLLLIGIGIQQESTLIKSHKIPEFDVMQWETLLIQG